MKNYQSAFWFIFHLSCLLSLMSYFANILLYNTSLTWLPCESAAEADKSGWAEYILLL